MKNTLKQIEKIKDELLAAVEMQFVNYKKLMELVNLWIDLALEHSKIKLHLTRHKNKKEQ